MTIRVRANKANTYYDIVSSGYKKSSTHILVTIGNKEEYLNNKDTIEKLIDIFNASTEKLNDFEFRKEEFFIKNGKKTKRLNFQEALDYYSKTYQFKLENPTPQTYTSHFPLRKLWEDLNMEVLFRNIVQKHKKYKSNDKGEKYNSISFNLDTVSFFLTAERIVNPRSKYDTWYKRYKHFFNYNDIKLDHIYECLEVLSVNQDRIINHLNKEARKLIKDRELTVCLYDVTTLYFESFVEDDLRQRGFSKDSKTHETQVVLGLLADKNGLPLSFNVFPGKTAEINTLIEVVDKAKLKYDIEKVTIVADAGLNQLKNLVKLGEKGYTWIVGYPPIGNKLTRVEKSKLINRDSWKSFRTATGELISMMEIPLKKALKVPDEETKIVEGRYISVYSSKRAKHDDYELEKKVEKAKETINKGTSEVERISQKGFKSFITLDKSSRRSDEEKSYILNQRKIAERKQWSGYSGYFTNISLDSMESVISKIKGLWKIEECFRTVKSTLMARPMFVWKKDSIKGHIMLCYVSLFMTRLLQLKLKEEGISLSDLALVRALKSNPLNLVSGKGGDQEFRPAPESVRINRDNLDDEDLYKIVDDCNDLDNLIAIMKVLNQTPIICRIKRRYIKQFLNLKTKTLL